ncbi:hypothetical protein GCM10009119_05190 [Algoriphagus jejuensis]|uniref:HTH marR-type domain-containing protein n=1 Tax=Algoriphagus jejuensis TaxID=419934 RepID=A0ABN1MWS1_9BACT
MQLDSLPSVRLSKTLYTLSRILIQRIQLTLNDFNLTYPQFLTLQILWEEDGLKVHELGKKLSLDSGTLTPLLKKLEIQNLLKRKRGEVDERTVLIHLSYPGKSLQAKVMDAMRMLEAELSTELGAETNGLLAAADAYFVKLTSN